MKVNVNVDTSELVNYLGDCENDLAEINNKIEAFNIKYSDFAEIKGQIRTVNDETMREKLVSLMKYSKI